MPLRQIEITVLGPYFQHLLAHGSVMWSASYLVKFTFQDSSVLKTKRRLIQIDGSVVLRNQAESERKGGRKVNNNIPSLHLRLIYQDFTTGNITNPPP